MKNKLTVVHYGTSRRNVQLKIDEFFAEKAIPANDSVRLLDEIVEEMDLSPLHRAYKRTGRQPATKPATMLKILLYANMEHIYSSRKIQSACQRDINFIWLLDGTPAPSHNEIARFRSIRLAECGEELFYQLVRKLGELGEITFEHLFVDGTKIEANASKYSYSLSDSIGATGMATEGGSETRHQGIEKPQRVHKTRRKYLRQEKIWKPAIKHLPAERSGGRA